MNLPWGVCDPSSKINSISFQCIIKSLKFFGFKEDILKWVKVLLNNFIATINLTGNLTEFFAILRGCRQGDPIAALLFIISIEILAIRLRNHSGIKGFKIGNLETLLSLYADDLSVFLEYDESTLRNAVQVLKDFWCFSGLKIQVEKKSMHPHWQPSLARLPTLS